MRHAIINKDGRVVNVVEWEGLAWLPPREHYCVAAPGIDIGDQYNFETNEFIKTITIAQDEELV